jgi:hypothetical protein
MPPLLLDFLTNKTFENQVVYYALNYSSTFKRPEIAFIVTSAFYGDYFLLLWTSQAGQLANNKNMAGQFKIYSRHLINNPCKQISVGQEAFGKVLLDFFQICRSLSSWSLSGPLSIRIQQNFDMVLGSVASFCIPRWWLHHLRHHDILVMYPDERQTHPDLHHLHEVPSSMWPYLYPYGPCCTSRVMPCRYHVWPQGHRRQSLQHLIEASCNIPLVSIGILLIECVLENKFPWKINETKDVIVQWRSSTRYRYQVKCV